MTAIILAGGKASRMNGSSKAFLRINHEPLVRRQLRALKKIFTQIIIVTNTPREYRNFKGVKVISDLVVGQGALGGIFSGLSLSRSKYNFVVACDMPFISLGLIKYMYKSVTGYDIVVPKINGRYEPLFGIYSKSCLRIIKESLDKKDPKIRKIFYKMKLKTIGKKEVLKFGHPERLFMNINTPEDLSLILADK